MKKNGARVRVLRAKLYIAEEYRMLQPGGLMVYFNPLWLKAFWSMAAVKKYAKSLGGIVSVSVTLESDPNEPGVAIDDSIAIKKPKNG